jgi:hypothetical protein
MKRPPGVTPGAKKGEQITLRDTSVSQVNEEIKHMPKILSSSREQANAGCRFLLGDTFEAAELNNISYVFTASRDFRPAAARGYKALEKQMDSGAVYFTPNTFYSRREKTKSALRWLNAIFVDIDDPALIADDIFDRCWEQGLPVPSLINKTPGGLHVYWKIKPVRATEKALRLYASLLRSVAVAVDGDPAAATPERYLRIPRCIVHSSAAAYTLQDFSKWRDENVETATPGSRETGALVTNGILDHPAVQKLLEGVEKGRRDNTAFTLALAFKTAGHTEAQTLAVLQAWNFKNRPPLPAAQLRAKARSAYKSKYRGPSAHWISSLAGMPFKYRRVTRIAKNEQKRRPGRPGKRPEVRVQLLALLQENGGSIEVRNQSELAKRIRISTMTLRREIATLKNEGMLIVKTLRLGKGRGAMTTYALTPPVRGNAVAETAITCSKLAIHVGTVGGAWCPTTGNPSLPGLSVKVCGTGLRPERSAGGGNCETDALAGERAAGRQVQAGCKQQMEMVRGGLARTDADIQVRIQSVCQFLEKSDRRVCPPAFHAGNDGLGGAAPGGQVGLSDSHLNAPFNNGP